MSNEQTAILFDDLNIEKCFKNFYVVPDYQREYVWEEKQVNQLLSDILEEYDERLKKEYFIGSIVVYNNKDGVLELIDGQQRTTTLFLLICAFKEIYQKRELDTSIFDRMIKEQTIDQVGKPVNRYRIELQYSDASDYLIRLSEKIDIPESLTVSGQKLYSAYRNITEFLECNFNSNESLNLFFAYIYRYIRFIQIETPDINDALKIFETVNERGIGLSPMDLLKNLIFRQVERDEFSQLKKKWEELIRILEDNREKPLRFLRYFIMANYLVKNKNNDAIVREDEIYTWFVDNKEQCNYVERPFEFVDKLIENAKAYINYFNGRDNFGENVYLNNIRKLGGGAFRQHLIILLAAHNKSKEVFDYLAKQIETLIYYYIITKEPTRSFEQNFSKWASIIKQTNSLSDIKQFIEKYFVPDINQKQKIYDSIFNEIGQGSLQQYRIRYILAKIAQYMDLERLGSYDVQNLDKYITKGVEIEHILPYTPEHETYEIVSEEIYDDCKIKLGNLTLLEKSINCSIGNKSFYSVKRNDYPKSQFYITKSIVTVEDVGDKTAINRLNKKLKSWENWDHSAIDERQNMLLQLSKEIWKIN